MLRIVASLAVVGINLAVAEPWVRAATGALTLTLAPGSLLVLLLPDGRRWSRLDRLFLAAGLGVLWSGVVLYLSLLVAGYGSRPLVAAPTLLAAAAALAWGRRERPAGGAETRSHGALIVVLIVAAGLRFTFLGSSEFQGDEAGNCVLNAAALLGGDRTVLFEQIQTSFNRPPLQLVEAAAGWLAFGSFDEGLIRLPFAIAGLALVWAAYALGRELYRDERVGIVAAALLAVSGFFVAFARIVQFQSLLHLGLVLVLLFLARARHFEGASGRRAYLLLGAGCFASALLGHFEAALFLPVIAVGLGARAFDRAARRDLAAGFVLVVVIAASFYLPFVLHPGVLGGSGRHLAERTAGIIHFNLPALVRTGSLYNSWPFLLVVGGFLAAALRRLREEESRALWVWLGWFALVFLVFARNAGTHFVAFFVPACVLAARGFEDLTQRERGTERRRNVVAVLVALALVAALLWSGLHVWTLLVRRSPEVIWTKPQLIGRIGAIFGFPYHRGWKSVGVLFRSGQLDGAFTTNERSKIAAFYLRQAPVSEDGARFWVVVRDPQSRRQAHQLGPEYALRAEVRSGDEWGLRVFERGATEEHVMRIEDDALAPRYAAFDRHVAGLLPAAGQLDDRLAP